jgi:small multidrug resistance pump
VRKWLYLGLAIVLEVTATLALRGALDRPWLWVVTVTGYLASFTMMAALLRLGMGVGVAYGIWAACGVALTAVLATVLFGDPLTPMMGAGIALVIGGVLCVELGAAQARTS